jgi:hypothetical protein
MERNWPSARDYQLDFRFSFASGIIARMADEPMSKAQAEQFQRNLQMLSESHVQEHYRKAYTDCALSHGRVPTPVEIQRLLCVWKVLHQWAMRQRGRGQ